MLLDLKIIEKTNQRSRREKSNKYNKKDGQLRERKMLYDKIIWQVVTYNNT